MESAAKAWNLAAAWDHLPTGRPASLLSRRASTYGHLHRPYYHGSDLELGGEMGFDDDGAEIGFAFELPRGRHGRHRPRLDLDMSDDDNDGGGGGSDGAGASGSCGDGDGQDEDADDFAFGIVDLFDLTYAVGVCIPPYPIYKNTSSYRDLHADAWTWLTFLYSLFFTILVTVFSVRVFRSSRRLQPTALRALVLALSISAQVSAAAHFLPSSRLTTGVSSTSILLHTFVYILAWCACCSTSCRQMVCCL